MSTFTRYREWFALGLGGLVSFIIAFSGWPVVVAVVAGLMTILAVWAL